MNRVAKADSVFGRVCVTVCGLTIERSIGQSYTLYSCVLVTFLLVFILLFLETNEHSHLYCDAS